MGTTSRSSSADDINAVEGHASEPSRSVFQDIPDGIDETWRHGALIGGMVNWAVTRPGAVADQFNRALDILVEAAVTEDQAERLAYPILFVCRHAIELYLKAVVRPSGRDHRLEPLLKEFQNLCRDRFGEEVPERICRLVREFETYDSSSTTFRYPDISSSALKSDPPGNAIQLADESWVDLRNLQAEMKELGRSCARIVEALKNVGG